jgi:hypothetical protein
MSTSISSVSCGLCSEDAKNRRTEKEEADHNHQNPADDKSSIMVDDKGSEEIYKSKWLACKILIRILEIQNECRVNSILFKFNNLSHASLSKKKTSDTGLSRQTLDNLLLGIRGSSDELKDPQLMKDFMDVYLNSIYDNCFIDLSVDQEMSPILLSLTLNSDLKLKTEALRLLYCLHSQINITRANIEETIILDAANTKLSHRDSVNLSRALKRISETAEKWYCELHADKVEIFDNLMSIIESHLLQPQ